jgi:hypothetical protein
VVFVELPAVTRPSNEGSDVMNYRAFLSCLFLFAFATVSAAQEPKGRIDLGTPFSMFAFGRITFVEGGSGCPEERGTLRISGGTPALMWGPSNKHRGLVRRVDDKTSRYHVETRACWLDVAVRKEVLRDGSWTSVLVAGTQPPIVPLEERREVPRQGNTPQQPLPALEGLLDRLGAGAGEQRPIADPNVGGYAFRWPFDFADDPPMCFEALGDYEIGPTGVLFSFVTALPGDLNRFVIERTDLDTNHGRLYFTRGDCRFEFTVSQSVLRNGEWISVPLAMAAPPKQ